MGVSGVDGRRGCRSSCERSRLVAGTNAGSRPARRFTRGVDRTAAGRESRVARPREGRQDRGVRHAHLGHLSRRADALARLLAERVLGRRLHARRRLHAVREPVQHARRARQHHVLRIQATGGGVHRAGVCSRAAATLSVLGGWREATAVDFYGLGHDIDSRTRERTTASSSRTSAPTSTCVRSATRCSCAAALEVTQWKQAPGSGDEPSVETVYTPQTLPGLGAPPVYLHTRRPSASIRGRRPATRGAAASTA